MTPRISIEVSSSGATAILRSCRGTLVFDELDELPGVVADLVRDGHKAIILNLDGLQFAGNRPLGMLVHVYATCHKADVPLVLCSVEHRTREILRITKLDQVFELHESEATAVSAVQARPPAAPDGGGAKDPLGDEETSQ